MLTSGQADKTLDFRETYFRLVAVSDIQQLDCMLLDDITTFHDDTLGTAVSQFVD